MGTPPPDDQTLHEQGIPPHIQNSTSFAHMRHAPSASPPMTNGAPYHHRAGTPQMQVGSRPGSRNGIRRPSSLGQQPHQATQAPGGPNGYAYMSNPSVYHPHGTQSMPSAPSHAPAPQHPQYYNQGHPPQHPHIQQFAQETRRQSMPPAFPQRDLPPKPPQVPSPPQIVKHEEQPEESPPNNGLKPTQTTKSRSIFTPIDDSRSLLAQHWTRPTSDARKVEKDSRSQSIDVGSVQHANAHEHTLPPPRPQMTHPPPSQQHDQQSELPPLSRHNSISQGGKRPQLKVQIPAEQSDEEGEGSAEESARHSGGDVREGSNPPVKGGNGNETNHSGVVLPPPSPSASAILSAGATGPPNPFARPAPPMSSGQNERAFSSNAGNGGSNSNNIETPISALPSRFVDNQLLPSPSSFYPDWGFGRGGGDSSNMLPSPLNFQTPVVGSGPGFGGKEDEGEKKRKSPEVVDGGDAKRIKT